MKLSIRFALFLFFLGSRICSGQPVPTMEAQKADSLLNIYFQANAPGMAVGIIQNGKMIYKKMYGLANLEHKIPISDSTAFNIASVSKQFTAFATLLAEQEGRLSLEDDIRTYLPELGHLPYKITIRQLANHTHGLPNFSDILHLQGIEDEVRVTAKDAIRIILGIKTISYPPRTAYRYNNTGFMLLAEILQRVYKKDFNQLLRELVFEPLQMSNSRAAGDPEQIIPNRSDAYQKDGSTFSKLGLGQMEYGSSNIYMTLNDFCQWAVNFQQPAVGSRELFNRMQQSTLLSTGESIGYGLGLQTEKYKGLDIVFHGGGTSGYRAYILHVPQQQFSVVLLGNKKSFDGLLIAYQLVDLFLGDQQGAPSAVKKTSYTSSDLRQFEGLYELYPGSYLEISAEGKGLYWGVYNEEGREALTIAGDNKFIITSIPTASLTFGSGRVSFRIADFTYHCKKVALDFPKTDRTDLDRFTGFYRCEEFNTIYELHLEGNKLVAKHPVNDDIRLFPIGEMSFASGKPHFGRIDFERTKDGSISGFTLSGAGVSNIPFKKM